MNPVAIIPCGGRGTRMAELTNGGAKELLPLHGRPVLSWILEEARLARLEPIVVAAPGKPDLIRYCSGQSVKVVMQDEPLGLAHAIAQVEHDGGAAVLLGDTIIRGATPITDMIEASTHSDATVLVQSISDHLVPYYGIVTVDKTGHATEIIEKPLPGEIHSRLAVCARYVLSASALNSLRAQVTVHRGPKEIGLTAVLNKLIHNGHVVNTVPLPPSGVRLDCGTPEEYQQALSFPWN